MTECTKPHHYAIHDFTSSAIIYQGDSGVIAIASLVSVANKAYAVAKHDDGTRCWSENERIESAALAANAMLSAAS